MEKFDTMEQLGRFTLRDEGKTIAIGKILKYKPFTGGILGASKTHAAPASTSGPQTIVNQSAAKELVFNMETGETSEKAQPMAAIAEGDEE